MVVTNHIKPPNISVGHHPATDLDEDPLWWKQLTSAARHCNTSIKLASFVR
jgi:hypothetical protein